jgi:endonuclease-8
VPEGDVVWRTARQLDAALAGQVLTRSDFRVPRFATADLAGRAVLNAVSRGKHLLTRVDGGLTIHTHLRMDGSWRIRPAGGYPPRDHRVRLVLANQSWHAIGYLLGVVELLPTAREDDVVGHLGPDLLGPDWDPAEAVRRLLADSDRPAAEALLDQRHLAGIGNLYKAELLFLRGIDPWSPIGTVDDLAELVQLAKHLLDLNKDRGIQLTTGVDRPGERTWVYGRARRPCRRCGTPIMVTDSGGQRAGQRTPAGGPRHGPGGGPGGGPGPGSGAGPGRGPGQRENALPSGLPGSPEARITFWCPACQHARQPQQPGPR